LKLGLICEGGASRAYFSSGVLDALLDENIIADYIIGASAGIANALSYASGQIGRNLCIAKKYTKDKRYMGFRHILNSNNRSYYNLNFVFDEIPNKYLPFDYEAFNHFKGDVFATVTNVNTGKAEYLKMPRDDKEFQILRASCALPLLFPIINIDGQPYMDGGISMPIPVEEAVNSGCDKNIVILTRERGYRKQKEKSLILAANLYKNKYPNFSNALLNRTEIYNNNLVRVKELEAAGKVFVIAPESISGFKRTESSPERLEDLHNQGYMQLKAMLPQLMDYINK